MPKIDPRYFRPTEVETLLGDPSKVKQTLGWMPEITLDEGWGKAVVERLSYRRWFDKLTTNG